MANNIDDNTKIMTRKELDNLKSKLAALQAEERELDKQKAALHEQIAAFECESRRGALKVRREFFGEKPRLFLLLSLGKTPRGKRERWIELYSTFDVEKMDDFLNGLIVDMSCIQSDFHRLYVSEKPAPAPIVTEYSSLEDAIKSWGDNADG